MTQIQKSVWAWRSIHHWVVPRGHPPGCLSITSDTKIKPTSLDYWDSQSPFLSRSRLCTSAYPTGRWLGLRGGIPGKERGQKSRRETLIPWGAAEDAAVYRGSFCKSIFFLGGPYPFAFPSCWILPTWILCLGKIPLKRRLSDEWSCQRWGVCVCVCV